MFNRLILNDGSYISTTVVKYIMVVSGQFERTNDRSFQIAGQYPITPSTLGPVSIQQALPTSLVDQELT